MDSLEKPTSQWPQPRPAPTPFHPAPGASSRNLGEGALSGERREEEDEEEEIEAAGVRWRLESGMDEALQTLIGSLDPSPPASPS